MVSDEEGFVEFLIEVTDKMLPADWRYFEWELFDFQCHVVYLLHCLGSIDEVLYLVGNLQGAIEFLPVHG